MPFCARCASEYEDWVERCDDCDLPLRGTATAPGLVGDHDDEAQASAARINRYAALRQPLPPVVFAPPTPPMPPMPPQPMLAARNLGRNRRLRLPQMGRELPAAGLSEGAASLVAPPRPPTPNPSPARGEGSYAGFPTRGEGSYDTSYVLPANAAPPPERDSRNGSSNWVVVTNTPNEMMAQLIKSQLDDEGIPAIIKLMSGTDNGQFINNAWVGRDIWVQAGSAERARKVIDSYRGQGYYQGRDDEFEDEDVDWDESLVDSGSGNYNEARRRSQYADYIPASELVGLDDRKPYKPAGMDTQKLVRWVSLALMIVFIAPFVIQLLQNVFSNLRGIFG